MKVLHVIPSISERSGGPGQAIFPMCQALRNYGVELMLASTDADLDETEDLQRESVFEYKKIPIILFRKQLGASFKYSRPFSRWLNENVSSFDVVHIHAVFNHACMAASAACREKGVPYIVRPLGTLGPWALSQKSLRKRIFWLAGIKTMLKNSAAIHYTSPGEKDAAEKSLGLNHGVVIPLGIDASPKQERVTRLGASPFETSSPYVLVMSRLLPTKGIDVLLEAFLSVIKRDEFKKWRLVLAGEGPADYLASLKRSIRRDGVEQSVIFTGWIDGEAKQKALRNASILALPSHHENFGLCVMEALAHGVPVLISPQVNLAPEVEAAEAGWVAEVDKAALEKMLVAACSSSEDRLRRGNNGERLAQNYDWARIADQLRRLYGEVVSKATEAKATVAQHA